VHVGWQVNNVVRTILEEIFGNENFRNEIIWAFTGRLMYTPYQFNSKHQHILFFSKSKLHRLNEITEEIDPENYIKMKKQEVHTDEDGRQWIWGHAGKGKSHVYKIYIDEVVSKGKNLNDVWNIPIINTSSYEKTGFSTPSQKNF
jgi:site-specific DNA-methyltransferase (adenine-specific)